ncbi:HNH endonuclease [Oceanobacillus sojae]|uniref:HNH endonuclease n=1 Tax=Oceanobacillus sojae TaxID=582851 RepID=UPI0009883B6F
MTAKPHGLVKLTVEEAGQEVREFGMEPLFEEYFGSSRPLKVRCVCGEVYYPTLKNIRKGQQCKSCGYKRRKERTIPYEEVRSYMESEGCVLLVRKSDYKRSSDYMDFICSCGEFGCTNFYNFKKGVRCKSCAFRRISGHLHYNYKPELSEEYREKGRYDRSLKLWRYEVKKRDNFTCVFCEDDTGGNLVSHHLDSYDSFPEKRLDISNGVTLCVDCHKDFHELYGYGGNTRQQFEELTARCKVDWEGALSYV